MVAVCYRVTPVNSIYIHMYFYIELWYNKYIMKMLEDILDPGAVPGASTINEYIEIMGAK